MKKKKKINTRNIKILACVLLVGFVLVFGIQFWLSSTGSASDQSQSGSGSTEEPDQSTTVHTELTEDQKKDRKVQELLKDMTLDQKIGQLFLARVPESGAVADIQSWGLGGYLIFGRDVDGETTESFQAKTASWQSASAVPMLVASDEEGGDVTRVSYGDGMVDTPFPSPQELYAENGLTAVEDDATTKAQILKNLGINDNLAPVADVAEDPDSFMYSRTMGQDASGEADFVKTVITATEGTGVGSCLKHIPGYGENGDSHTDIVHDDRDLDHFETIDFIPFKAGIEAGADAVLICHNIVSAFDGTQPASLSPAVHQVLRNELGFTGVIITDDFDMAGLADYTDQKTGAVDTIKAGSDMIISSSYADQIPAVRAAVQDGTITEDEIDAAAGKVLRWKINLGLISYDDVQDTTNS